MDFKDIDGLRFMHIDTSCRLNQRKDTAIAYRIIGSELHKGVGLKLRLKKDLERSLNADYDYARIYAISIYYLIKDSLDDFDVLIICNDENIKYVKSYLDILFSGMDSYFKKSVLSITELRNITGNKKIRSYADNTARSYRKRVLKLPKRQKTGLCLNPIKITLKMYCDKWFEIEDNKNGVSGS